MSYVIHFTDPDATRHDLVGGKGANLGRLVAAGFDVPPGFNVTTRAYSEFMVASGLLDEITAILDAIDYNDPVGIEAATGQIRSLIMSRPSTDELRTVVASAYDELAAGDGQLAVAVRSSGTAEDLAEASFAGLHDTYLDVIGIDALFDAMRRCWASLWTGRATAYRFDKGFAHKDAALCVVVQKMVASEVAGVMFTANPINAAVNEIVVNASWGLGEGVVSGILTPDEYVLDRDTLRVKRRILGSKEMRVVRNPETGQGTVHEPVPVSLQAQFTFDDDRVADLGLLGRRVMEYYDGFPQDIEWAYADGAFYLLQSRPVTGVELTWDEDVDGWQPGAEHDDTVWTYTWSEQYWTGGISPLFYSCRAHECQLNYSRAAKVFGFEDNLTNEWWHKYRRGTAYFNANAERDWLVAQWPSRFRDLTNIPPVWQQEFLATKTPKWGFVKLWLRVHALTPELGVTRWWKSTYDYLDNRTAEADGPSVEELRRMSDTALLRQAEQAVAFVDEWYITLWPGFFWLASGAFGGLGLMLEKWYDGDNEGIFQDLISGIPGTKMVEETDEMWDLAELLRQSPELTRLADECDGDTFFPALEQSEAGLAFLVKYREFLHNHGHRGHQDRDFYYYRRVEQPSLDYDAFKQLLSTTGAADPRDNMKRMVAKREAATADVVGSLRRKTFSDVRITIFLQVLQYVQKFLKYREDERHYLDRLTFGKKKIFLEIGQRMWDRGMLDEEDDFWFLARHELYAYFEGRSNAKLARAKMQARKRVFHKRNAREEPTPTFVQHGFEVDLHGTAPSDDNALSGFGTSRGQVSGFARVVPQLDQIGRVQEGDILVCNSTDPGWMSVFPKIKGLVLETGGMLSHGACLSREYGIPAVQIRGAMRLIDDGIEISVNGDNGTVRVLADAELDGN